MRRVYVAVRLPADLAAWLAEYALERGVTRTAIVVAALRHFQALAEGAAPELEEA